MPAQGDVASVIRKRSTRHNQYFRILYLIFVAGALVSATWTAEMMSSTLFGKKAPPPEDPTTVKPTKGFARNLKSFISGGFGGVCVVFVGHPLDLVST